MLHRNRGENETSLNEQIYSRHNVNNILLINGLTLI